MCRLDRLNGEQKKKIAALFQEGIKQFSGKGPTDISIVCTGPLVSIRCSGFMTLLEKQVAVTPEGSALVVDARKKLFFEHKPGLVESLIEITGRTPDRVFDDYIPEEDMMDVGIYFK